MILGHDLVTQLTRPSLNARLVTRYITMLLVFVLRLNVHSIGRAKGLNNTVILRSLLQTGLSSLTTL